MLPLESDVKIIVTIEFDYSTSQVTFKVRYATLVQHFHAAQQMALYLDHHSHRRFSPVVYAEECEAGIIVYLLYED